MFKARIHLLLLAAGMAIVAAIIWPGLSGPLVFDDLTNLAPLLEAEPVYRQAIMENNAGPIGRALTMATFALNHWVRGGIVIFDLKFTNLLIHLLNGYLVYRLITMLLRRRCLPQKASFLAAVIAVFWMGNPVNISTVLYVIQRSTLLSATFVLAGCLCYVRGRDAHQIHWRGYSRTAALCLGCWVMASLSKETGLLLPLYLLIIEACFLYGDRVLPWRWILGGAMLPVIVLAALVYTPAREVTAMLSYSGRPFTMTERLLTEPVVMTRYLRDILLPGRADTGLYHDDFSVQSNLRNPATLGGGFLLLFLLTASLRALRYPRYRTLAAGMLMYLSGHLLESTIFPLELYFSHRNYFPALGLFMTLVLILERLAATGRLRSIFMTAGVVYSGLLGMQSYSLANVWSSRISILQNAAGLHPGSLRANLELTGLLAENRQWDDALELNSRYIETYPKSALPARLQRLYVYCERGDGIPDTETGIGQHHIKLEYPLLVSTALSRLIESHARNGCAYINLDLLMKQMAQWVDGQARSGIFDAEELWTIDYYIIDFLFRTDDNSLAMQRLDMQVRGGNPKAKAYRDVINPHD